LVAGLATFTPKYVEVQFGIPSSTSALYLGMYLGYMGKFYFTNQIENMHTDVTPRIFCIHIFTF